MVTTALAGAIVAGMFWLIARKQSEEDWVRHTLAVRNQLANVLILVQRTETGQRGYLLTDRDVYLEPYNAAVGELSSAIDETAKLVSDNPRQRKAVEELRPLIAQKLKELRATIDERRAGRFDAALAIVDTDQGLRLMDAIRSNISSMQAEEDRLLADRQQRASTFGMLLQIGAASAFIILICRCGYACRLFHSTLLLRAHGCARSAHDHERGAAGAGQPREQVESHLRQAQQHQQASLSHVRASFPRNSGFGLGQQCTPPAVLYFAPNRCSKHQPPQAAKPRAKRHLTQCATARSSRVLRQRAIALLVAGCMATLCELRHIIVCPHLLASLHVFRMRTHWDCTGHNGELVTLMFFADAAGMID